MANIGPTEEEKKNMAAAANDPKRKEEPKPKEATMQVESDFEDVVEGPALSRPIVLALPAQSANRYRVDARDEEDDETNGAALQFSNEEWNIIIDWFDIDRSRPSPPSA